MQYILALALYGRNKKRKREREREREDCRLSSLKKSLRILKSSLVLWSFFFFFLSRLCSLAVWQTIKETILRLWFWLKHTQKQKERQTDAFPSRLVLRLNATHFPTIFFKHFFFYNAKEEKDGEEDAVFTKGAIYCYVPFLLVLFFRCCSFAFLSRTVFFFFAGQFTLLPLFWCSPPVLCRTPIEHTELLLLLLFFNFAPF